MKLFEFFRTSKFKKIGLYSVLGILALYAGVFIYSLVFEQDKLAVDRYNFEQLENTKPILTSIKKNDRWVYSLKEFNERYNADLKPIKNCYFVRNFNGGHSYIFGFQLESLMYRFIYFGKNYAYPKYDYSYTQMCIQGIGCYDGIKDLFLKTISNPCMD